MEHKPTKVKFSDCNIVSSSSGPVAHSTPSKAPPQKSEIQNGSVGSEMMDCSTRFMYKQNLITSPTKSPVSDMERDTIVRQRTELQLLINELKDRDKELNEMVSAHHQHMRAWEEDRTRFQNMDIKSAKLERDLHKRNSQIRELLKKLKAIEVEALNASTALDNTKMQLSTVVEDQSNTRNQMRELQEQNNHLQKSLQEMSKALGESDSKVNHLTNALNKKEKEAVVTSKEVTELASRLQSLEFSYKQLEKITFDVKQSAAEWKVRCSDLRQEAECLKSELSIANATTEEKDITLQNIIRDMKERNEELVHANERERRKDQLLESQRSKQDRTDSELTTLRQMYDLQQHKLEALRKELTEVKETARQQTVSFVQDDRYNLTDTSHSLINTSAFSTPEKKSTLKSPLRRSLSPHRDQSDESVNSATERLQRLLKESKSLVETINGTQSRTSSRLSDTRLSPSGLSFNLSANGGR